MAKLHLETLLSNGWFPSELPPPFSTKDFALFTGLEFLGIKLPVEYTCKKPRDAAICGYSLARPGELRRRLAIVNPVPYFHLSFAVVENQDKLFSLANSQLHCLSAPEAGHGGGRAIVRRSGLSEIPRERARSRVGGHFVLRADISNFYGSIYTHAVDWAITGKTKAKAKHGPKVSRPGITIDACLQALQLRQTRGIPIGPDTSLLLSHVMLARVDEFLKKAKILDGYRYMDDYELFFNDKPSAEKALAILENGLRDYELDLNTHKTEIIELPMRMDTPVLELQGMELRHPTTKGGRRQSASIIRFFERAFGLAKEYPNLPMLQYAVGRIHKVTEGFEDAELVRDLILQCATIEPGVLPRGIDVLARIYREDPSIDKLPIAKMIDAVIRRHAPKGHSSEVAYALWAALGFEIDVSNPVVNMVAKMQCDICALLLLDLYRRGHASIGNGATRHFAKMATREQLFGPHWLFAYEAVARGWFSPRGGNYISKERAFAFLEDNNIFFYDDSLASSILEKPEDERLLLQEDDGEY